MAGGCELLLIITSIHFVLRNFQGFQAREILTRCQYISEAGLLTESLHLQEETTFIVLLA